MELKDTRSGFGEALLELGEINKNIVALCADLTGSLKMDAFKEKYPDRFFQIGIAEANMMGIAAGMTSDVHTVQARVRFFDYETGESARLDDIAVVVTATAKPVSLSGGITDEPL